MLGQSSPCVLHFTHPALATDLPEHLPRPQLRLHFHTPASPGLPLRLCGSEIPLLLLCLTPSYSPLRFRPYPLLTFSLLLSFVRNSYVCVSSVMSNSLRLPGLQPARVLCPCNHPHKKTGVGCHLLLLGVFPTPRDRAHLSCISCTGKLILYYCATWEAHHFLHAEISFPTIIDYKFLKLKEYFLMRTISLGLSTCQYMLSKHLFIFLRPAE